MSAAAWTLAVVSVVAIFAPQLRTHDLGRRMVEGPGAVVLVAPPSPTTRLPDPIHQDELTGSMGVEIERLAT